jgi:methylmalonyl-CoA mutase cobalamin-binding domain/chain
MREHVRTLSRASRLPISILPNAGLPELVDGRTVYRLSPEELAAAHVEFVDQFGVGIVGGCCGTTPAHLAAVVEAVGSLRPRPRLLDRPRSHAPVRRAVRPTRPAAARPPPQDARETITVEYRPALASLYTAVPFEQENTFLAIGERANANGSRAFRDLMLGGDLEGIVQLARSQTREGAHVLDVCVDYVGRDGVPDMVSVVDRYATSSTLPLVIDSTQTDVIEAALTRLGGRAVINSVNLEDGRVKADVLLPLARRYGAAVVVLAIDEEGQARTADWKVRVCERVARIAIDEYGLEAHDLIFDCLTFPLGSGADDLRRDAIETLDAIEAVKRAVPGCHTTLGLSNVSFGLSPAARQVLNSVFLEEAIARGLDSAIVHPGRILPLHRIPDEQVEVARDLIHDRRGSAGRGGTAPDDYDPLTELMALFDGVTSARRRPRTSWPRSASRSGSSAASSTATPTASRSDLDTALETHPPLEIINEFLLAGMRTVGELFADGRMQLPFVLQSAQTMKTAVAHLEPHIAAAGGASASAKGKVLIATVKGDVHDIGKNLVDIILRNNGYEVVNLGIKQSIDQILAAAEEHGVDAIGMSGLLVKSTVIMRENLEEMNHRGVAHYPVLLGGAALTRGYVEDDLRALYDGRSSTARTRSRRCACSPTCSARDGGRQVRRGRWRRGSRRRFEWGRDGGRSRRPQAAPSPPRRARGRGAPGGRRAGPAALARRVRRRRADPAVLGHACRARRADRRDRAAHQRGRAVPQPVGLHAGRPRSRRLPRAARARGATRAARPRRPREGRAHRHPGRSSTATTRRTATETTSSCGTPRRRSSASSCASRSPARTADASCASPTSCARRRWRARRAGRAGRHDGPPHHRGRRGPVREDRYQDYLYTHGFGVEMAEALAELWHRRMRQELGIAGEDGPTPQDWFRQGYRGSRYSFGYPACPEPRGPGAAVPPRRPVGHRRDAHRRVHAPPRAVDLGDRAAPPGGDLLQRAGARGGAEHVTLPRDHVLVDGTTVHLREVRPDDAERVLGMWARTSAESRRARFMGPFTLDASNVGRFVDLDAPQQFAVVATRGRGETERMSGSPATSSTRSVRGGPSSPRSWRTPSRVVASAPRWYARSRCAAGEVGITHLVRRHPREQHAHAQPRAPARPRVRGGR